MSSLARAAKARIGRTEQGLLAHLSSPDIRSYTVASADLVSFITAELGLGQVAQRLHTGHRTGTP
jgi:hypothetical protein